MNMKIKKLLNMFKKSKKKIFNFYKKKGVGAIIVTILLIIVAIILIIVLLSFGKGFTGSKLDDTEVLISDYKTCGYAMNISATLQANNNILLRNNYSEEITVLGYSIISTRQASMLNKYVVLDNPLALSSGSSGILPIVCYPDREFVLELLLNDNCRITKKVNTLTSQIALCGGSEPVQNNSKIYEIWYLEHLNYIRTNEDTRDADYVLLRSLDFNNPESYYDPEKNLSEWTNGNGWVPIGTVSNPFTGSFDGNNKTISNLHIDRSTTDHVGLFGYVAIDAIIEKIGAINANVTGKDYVGALVGNHLGELSNSYSTGEVFGTRYIGGLVGGSEAAGNIYNSYSNADVSGTQNLGGLVGGFGYGTVSNCYATGTLSGGNTVGGLIGANSSTGIIVNSYSMGLVSGSEELGGLIGKNNSGSVESCYFDVDTSEQSGGDGDPKSTEEMKLRETFGEWDLSTIWNIQDGITYPFLRNNTQSPLPQ